LIDDAKLEQTLDWLRDNAGKAAKARAERVYMEEWLPSLRAQLAAKFIESGDSAAAADMKAKAHQDYRNALEGYRQAVEADELMRWHRTRADALVEVWRSDQANQRAMGKVI
jgi:hypothetical protein